MKAVQVSKLITILSCLIILVLFYVAGNTIQIPYTAMTNYTEQEPFTVSKCHMEDFKYSTGGITFSRGTPRYPNYVYSFEIYNEEPRYVNGNFSYNVMWHIHTPTYDQDFSGRCKNDYYQYPEDMNIPFPGLLGIGGQLLGKAMCWVNASYYFEHYGEDGFEITIKDVQIGPPKKEVCSNVTEYKTVQKQRGETRYKTVFRYWSEY